MIRSVTVKTTYSDEHIGDVLDYKLESLQKEGHTILGVHQVKDYQRVGFYRDEFVVIYEDGKLYIKEE